MIISKELWSFLEINFINIFMITICILASYFGYLGYIISLIVLVTYCIYILTKDERRIVFYQMYLFVVIEFILDFLFQYTPFSPPLELKYLIDFISFILLLKIIRNKEMYTIILKDRVFQFILLAIIFNCCLFFFQENSFLEFINAFRIYFRFLPVYIIISCKGLDIIKSYNFLYYSNLIVLIFQVLAGTHQDMRNGFFGLVGAHTFAVFISIKMISQTIKFSMNKTSLLKFLSFFGITILILAVVENKSFIVLLAICVVLIILLNRMKAYKKLLISLSTFIVIVMGINILVHLYPNFSYFLSVENLRHNIEDYIFGNSNEKSFAMGRYEALNYISQIENTTLNDSLFGNGFGVSIPQENWFYLNGGKGKDVLDFPKSNIYEKYGAGIGYHLSSFNYIYIDNGVLGVIFFSVLIITVFIRSITLLRTTKAIYDKVICSTGILTSVTAIYICGYAGGLINRGYTYLIFICLGLLTNVYFENFSIDR